MSELVNDLRREHRRFAILLNILEGETRSYCSGAAIDFDLLTSVVEYFGGYPESCHHPIENLMYGRLVARLPEIAKGVERIEKEHHTSRRQVSAIKRALDNILSGRSVSRSVFEKVVYDFVKFQREHIKQEEKRFFPVIEEFLTDADWKAIKTQMADKKDPLIDPKDKGEFEDLRHAIINWESAQVSA